MTTKNDNLQIRIGELLLRTAGIVAALGRKVQGKPFRVLSAEVPMQQTWIELSDPIPHFVRGVRIEGESADEIAIVTGVEGKRVLLDRPLAQSYPQGAKVKVLV